MSNNDYSSYELFCVLYKTGKFVRKCLENKYVFKAPELYGCCVEASDMLITQLN